MEYAINGTLGWDDDPKLAQFTLVIDYTDIPEQTLLARAAAHDIISFRRPHKARGRDHVVNMNGQTYRVPWADVGKSDPTDKVVERAKSDPTYRARLEAQLAEIDNE